MSVISLGGNNAQYQPQNQIGSILAAQKAANQTAANSAAAGGGVAGLSGAQTAANADQLATLKESNWAGIPFPNTGVVDDISFDLAVHKFPGLDGARVENTGRNPGVFQITGVFSNHIQPAVNETWKAGSLYPTVFQQMYNALLLNKEGPFIHPALGSINCRVVNFKTMIEPKFRDGQMITMTFMETIAGTVSLLQTPSSPGASAASLDNAISNNPSLVPSTMSFPNFFSSLVASIKAVTAIPTAISASILGTINSCIFQVKSLIDYLKNAWGNDPINGILTAPILNQSYLLLGQLITSKTLNGLAANYSSTVNNNKTIGVFTTTNKTTLCTLSTTLGNSITQMCTLNPNLLGTLIIPTNTVVKFFNQ